MAWTYNSSLGADKDRVRFLVGDTNTDDQQLQDAEIEFLLEQHGTLNLAAAAACRALATKYARYADKWVGDLKILASQKSEAYERMADRFEAEATAAFTSVSVPTAGGILVADKETQAEDDSLVQPGFRIGMHDNLDTW